MNGAPAGKWRPSLGLIVFAVLAVVAATPLVLVLLSRHATAIFDDRPGMLTALIVVTVLAVTLMVGFVFLRAITRPIHELIARAEAIAAGNRAAIRPLDRHGTREIAMLSDSLLDMARRLVERSDYVSTLSAHLSHELKSPLTAIQGAAELLAETGETMSPEERRRFVANIIADGARLTALARRLRELGRADNPRLGETTTLGPVLRRLGDECPDIAVHPEGDLDVVWPMSEENAGIVFSHLADNAAHHGASQVAILVSADDAGVRVTVRDDGNGISPQNRPRIFDPFFTTRREAGGTGMGLGIVRSVLTAHGGAIALLDSDRGAAFEIRMPAGETASRSTATAEHRAGRSRTAPRPP